MFYQDLNGNYQYGDSSNGFRCFQRMLPAIYEDRFLHNVPDINLECNETIDWEELEPCIYSSLTNEKFQVYEGESRGTEIDEGSSQFYHDYPPPNSPVKGIEVDQPVLILKSHYVNSLLQIWRDSQKSDTQESCEGSDGFSLPSDEPQSSQETYTSSEDQSDDFNEMALESEATQSEGSQRNNCVSNEHEHTATSTSDEMEQLNTLPVSQSSSRSNSPAVLEMLSQFRQNVHNLRSVSPIIMRSPSPINSRSSSPRFLRSPSPLEFLEQSLSNLPLDSSNELVFYEDRYILRSYSPVSTGSGDHQVPDVNMDFQQAVSDSEEFPSFRSYSQRRIQNSCEDQVVPDYIEE